jgi:predicted amidohydrolase YtcJ
MPLDALITGRIATLQGESGFGWVEAIGIRDGRIAFAGSEVYLETRADPFTERIRLEPGQVAIPGLTDAHLHLAQAATASRHVDLGDSPTLEDGLVRLREAHERLPADAWLEGHGWDSDRWGGWPTADALEAVAPGRKAAIWAHDHHALWTSHAAVRAAELPAGDPPGGVIRRADDRTPEGVLYEAATRLITIHVPPPSAEDLERAIIEVGQDLVSLGVVA